MEFDKVLEIIAKSNGVSKKEIIKEMEKAKESALKNPSHKEFWDKFRDENGDIPLETFIRLITEIAKTELENK